MFSSIVVGGKRQADHQKLMANAILGFMIDNHSDVTKVPYQLSRDIARALAVRQQTKVMNFFRLPCKPRSKAWAVQT